MTAVTHDGRAAAGPAPGARLTSGLVLAVVSAISFGASGGLARGLLDAGWTPGAVTLARVTVAALAVAPFGFPALRGQWWLLRRNAGLIGIYGVLAVAGAQFCYFSAVDAMQVAPALLIEYTSPAAVVVWLWLRHGQRPGPVTLVGAGLAALGLVLVLDVLGGVGLNAVGVAWALAAMIGAATYFVVSADDTTGLPPLTLAACGLVVGGVTLGVLGAVGALPLRATTATVTYSGHVVAWWLPMVALGLVTAAIAYGTGIAASRRLGSRLASFVALIEVVAGIGFAWLLLGELPRSVQLVGGALILGGVVVVKLGERVTVRPTTAPAVPVEPGLWA